LARCEHLDKVLWHTRGMAVWQAAASSLGVLFFFSFYSTASIDKLSSDARESGRSTLKATAEPHLVDR